jgi:hypothetical protein
MEYIVLVNMIQSIALPVLRGQLWDKEKHDRLILQACQLQIWRLSIANENARYIIIALE